MDDLRALSQQLAAVVETAGPAVVRVDARRRWPASGIAWSSDGVVVTADHVVGEDHPIEVGLSDGSVVPATLAGRDPTTDVAVLRLDAARPSPLTWGDSSELRVGHVVLGIARPGRTARAALGIMSAIGDSWRTPAGGDIDRYLQADLRMGPGFSGGLLIGVDGKAIGLMTSGLLRRRQSITLPESTLRRVVDTLLAHGRIRHGYLGIGSHPVRLPEPIAQQLHQPRGLLVVAVEPDGPADRSGLLLGDVIVSAGGQPIGRLDELRALLGADRVGVEVPVRILRAGHMQDVRVTIGERAA
jgi:S1-C subfamily serine protease